MWFITVLQKIEKDEKYMVRFGAERTWGYFHEKEVAVQALHENWTDMWEYLYDYAVLEYVEEGICPFINERQFFQFDMERKGYFEIEEPECVKRVCNFALG